MEKNRVQNKKDEAAEELRAQQEYLMEMGGVFSTRGKHAIHCLTVIGQIEGHSLAPQSQKTTKYEHVIPQLVAVEEDPAIHQAQDKSAEECVRAFAEAYARLSEE